MPASSARERSTTAASLVAPSDTRVMSSSRVLVISGVVMVGANRSRASMMAMPSWLGSTGLFLRYFTWKRRSMMEARVDLVPRPRLSISWMRRPWL